MSDRLEDIKTWVNRGEDGLFRIDTAAEHLKWLIAEVERLRQQKEPMLNWMEKAIEYQKQIESLQSQLAGARPGWCPICHERIHNKVQAEVERLRGIKKTLSQGFEDLAKRLSKEIESLQSQLAAAKAERTMYQECCGDEEVEREKLQTELDSLKLFTAGIVRDYKKLGGKLK